MSAEGSYAVEVGILGGTGIQEMPGLEVVDRLEVATPFGPPSARYVVGRLEGRTVAFLGRHGEGHRLLPSEINYRANIYGFKALGAQRILSASAVGSMRESIRPLDVVVVDQFIDRTRHRPDTFFGDGVVVHVAFGEPVCPVIRRALVDAVRRVGARVHDGGTYLCMEGPQFSTRAESRLYRSWAADVIGMTNLQEAKLAREAEICYATLALVTDYDAWREGEAAVTVEAVIENLRRNAGTAQAAVREALRALPERAGCGCAEALRGAILTSPERIPATTRERLGLLLDRHLA